VSNSITPPPELVEQWCANRGKHNSSDQFWRYIATQAAQWGANQELEACTSWLVLNGYGEAASRLCASRRPKPPSDKELALEALHRVQDLYPDLNNKATIRRALEALDD